MRLRCIPIILLLTACGSEADPTATNESASGGSSSGGNAAAGQPGSGGGGAIGSAGWTAGGSTGSGGSVAGAAGQGASAGAAGAAGGAGAPPQDPNAPLPYPNKAVAIYHMMWSNSGSPQLSALPANANVVNLAFAQGDPPQLVGWASQSKQSFVADAEAPRKKGVNIVISIGGAGGNVNVSHRQAFVDGIMAINSEVTLDGLDWDLEGPALVKDDVVWISKELKAKRGQNFSITMAPNGSNVDEYIPVAVALHQAGALDMIGQQFYDAVVSYGAALGRVNQMANAGIPDDRIGIGMMVGSADTYWTVSECKEAVNFIKGPHAGVRGGYLWEHGRSGTQEWADQVGALLLK
ncbi:MAG: glycosyl hydrolase family 18 protein [Polyangiaceae bacterium]